MGADGIILTAVETRKLSKEISLRQRLHDQRLCYRRQSLIDWLIRTLRNGWLYQSEVFMNIRNWRTIEEGKMLLRERRIRKAVFESQFTGPDRTVLTKNLKTRLTQRGPQGCNGASATLLSPLVEKDLYKAEKALLELSDLDQHVKRVHKVRKRNLEKIRSR